jgi:hypothetical protein
MQHSRFALCLSALIGAGFAHPVHAQTVYVKILPAVTQVAMGSTVNVQTQLSYSSSFTSPWVGTQVWFKSSNTNVFKVNDTGWETTAGVVGTVTPVAPGSAWLIAYDESGTTGSIEITVTNAVARVRIQCANGAWCDQASGSSVSVGKAAAQQLYVVALDASGNVLWKQPLAQ